MSTAWPLAMPERSACSPGVALLAVPAARSTDSCCQPTGACGGAAAAAMPRAAAPAPKPQAPTSGATVTSNAPPDSAAICCARASTASVRADKAKGVVAAWRLKRASSEAGS